MKKSIGMERAKFILDARKAILACFAISGGGEVLLAAASVVIRMTCFWFGQIKIQTLRNMMIPRKPPIEIETPHELLKKLPVSGQCSCSKRRPANTVISAPYLNHHNARGSNF